MANKSKRRQNSNGVQSNHTSSSNNDPFPNPPPPPPTTTTTSTSTTTATTATTISEDHNSPLRLFGEAKNRINEIYKRLEDCVKEAKDLYSVSEIKELEKQDDDRKNQVVELASTTEKIKNVLARNQMKVAFFGRTSNGKSTVINAILHDKVLPMGYGHTTGCFLQIEGNQQDEGYLKIEKEGQEEERISINSLSNLANKLNNDCLDHSNLVKICWPMSKCPLLKYDVVLVDSPGVDVAEDLDKYIEEYCDDADLFVLVFNTTSVMSLAEKDFFHRVSEKLSKPNIFILNNHWDMVSNDLDNEQIPKVRNQHITKSVDFLNNELNISTREEARNQTFFISARETLLTRLGSSIDPKPKGFSERNEEFITFERRFEESLSKSAIKTKFQKHTDRSKEIIEELNNILNASLLDMKHVSQTKVERLHERDVHLGMINSSFSENEHSFIGEISKVKAKIQTLADKEFSDEIKRLSRVVDNFENEFPSDLNKLPQYKESLYHYVEQELKKNLRSRIVEASGKHVDPFNKTMLNISRLLTKDIQQSIKSIIETQSYDHAFQYMLFYTNFQEDLEFRFSLSFVSIIRKFQSIFTGSTSTKAAAVPDNHSMTADTDFLAVVERSFALNPQSPTTVGSLALFGVAVRSLGLRVIVGVTICYCTLYAYEYFTWTSAAKERSFKSQYVKYAREGLYNCQSTVTKNISNDVDKVLKNTFEKVKERVDDESKKISNEIGLLKKSVATLTKCSEITRRLVGQNNELLADLATFVSEFLLM